MNKDEIQHNNNTNTLNMGCGLVMNKDEIQQA